MTASELLRHYEDYPRRVHHAASEREYHAREYIFDGLGLFEKDEETILSLCGLFRNAVRVGTKIMTDELLEAKERRRQATIKGCAKRMEKTLKSAAEMNRLDELGYFIRTVADHFELDASWCSRQITLYRKAKGLPARKRKRTNHIEPSKSIREEAKNVISQ